MPSKEPILFDPIRDGLPLLSIQPVRTASTIWRADASITAEVDITGHTPGRLR
jgi:hypothetical protein